MKSFPSLSGFKQDHISYSLAGECPIGPNPNKKTHAEAMHSWSTPGPLNVQRNVWFFSSLHPNKERSKDLGEGGITERLFALDLLLGRMPPHQEAWPLCVP